MALPHPGPLPKERENVPHSTEVLAVQCMDCRRWRVDAVWSPISVARANEPVSHGLCPQCCAQRLAALATEAV